MDSLHKYVEPIKKKWVYHFIVSPKTSVIEKPEWYLNQTLKWIYEHIDIVEKKVHNNSKNLKNWQTKQLFILHMLELSRMRLSKDMNCLSNRIGEDQQSDALLIHTYNEVIQFIKVICKLLGDKYNDLEENHDLMSVFAEQRLFEKIDDVEWEYSKKNFSEITTSESRWEPVLEGEYLDYYKIPRCVDRFLLLIRSISERLDCFTQIDCKYRLIDMQYESTIDLSLILKVLNGVNFLRLILKERCFIKPEVMSQLEKDLKTKLDRTTNEYKSFLNKLIDKVVAIYQSTDCDLQKFLDFIRPKLSHDIFELVRDEAFKIHEKFQTQEMIKGLSFGRE